MNWKLIIIVYSSLLALGLADNIRGPLFSEVMKEFQITDFLGSLMFAVSSFMALVFSQVSLFLARRFHQFQILQLAMFLMALGLALVSFAQSFGFLIFSVCFFGASIGLLGVSQNFLISKAATDHYRPRMLSGLHSMYGLASLLAPVLVAFLAQRSWKETFFFSAFVPLIVLGGSFFVSLRPDSMGEALEQKKAAQEDSRSKPFLMFSLTTALSLYVVAEIMVGTRLALYFQRELNYSLRESSFVLMIFFLLLLCGRMFTSFVHLSWRPQKVLKVSLASTLVCLVLGLCVHPFFLVLSGLSMAPYYPLAVSDLSDHFPVDFQKAISWAMAIQSLLVVIMHLSIGRLTDLFGLTWALAIGPVSIFVALVFLYFAGRRLRLGHI